MIKAEEGANPSQRGACSPREYFPLPCPGLFVSSPSLLPPSPANRPDASSSQSLPLPPETQAWPWALRPPGINQQIKGRGAGKRSKENSPSCCWLPIICCLFHPEETERVLEGRCPLGNLGGQGPSPAPEMSSLKPSKQTSPNQEEFFFSIKKPFRQVLLLFLPLAQARDRRQVCSRQTFTSRAEQGENFHMLSVISK